MGLVSAASAGLLTTICLAHTTLSGELKEEKKKLANNTDKEKDNVEKHTKCFSREAVV